MIWKRNQDTTEKTDTDQAMPVQASFGMPQFLTPEIPVRPIEIVADEEETNEYIIGGLKLRVSAGSSPDGQATVNVDAMHSPQGRFWPAAHYQPVFQQISIFAAHTPAGKGLSSFQKISIDHKLSSYKIEIKESQKGSISSEHLLAHIKKVCKVLQTQPKSFWLRTETTVQAMPPRTSAPASALSTCSV